MGSSSRWDAEKKPQGEEEAHGKVQASSKEGLLRGTWSIFKTVCGK
jgi:hypothetical protein